MKSMGTPEELKLFLEWVDNKKLSIKLDDVISNYNKHFKENNMIYLFTVCA